MKKYTALLVLLCITGIWSLTTYSKFRTFSENPCKYCTNHIACNSTWKLSPNCSADAELVKINGTSIDAIIDLNNKLRSMIAGGYDKFKPAVRMAKTRWNPELAEMARLNAIQCKAEHDTCRNTEAFPFVGQNMQVKDVRGRVDPIEVALQQIIDWFNECKYAPSDIVDSYRDLPDGTVGSFTGMCQEMGTDMGCAILRQSVSDDVRQQILVCNYSYINIVKVRVYTSGDTASQCATGVDKDYPNLCSANEIYDVTGIPYYRE